MPLNIGSTSYTIDAPSANAVVYRHPDATMTHKRTLRLARTDAKPTASYAGVTRSESKVSRMVDAGERIEPIILRAETSVPVEADGASLDAAIADFRAFISSDKFVNLVKSGTIYYG